MKNKYIFIILVNLIPYLILFIIWIFEYLNIGNQMGTSMGSLSIITFFLIFIFNIYHFPSIVISKMPIPLLFESRVIGVAISITLNTILFISIWYTAVKVDAIVRGY